MTHCFALYNGKNVCMDYIGDTKQEFKFACMRIKDNGADGIVLTPDGKKYSITQNSNKAKLLN